MDALTPMNAETLSEEKNNMAIASLIFVTEKRWINQGQPKLGKYINKWEVTSPTVITEVIFIASVIEVEERRQVAIDDLLDCLLDAMIFVREWLAELMTMVAPQKYRKYVTIEGGQKVVYVKGQKALYGMLKSALLFYKNSEKIWRKLGML